MQLEAQLQRAKFEGLAAVESLLKTSLGDISKDIYYFLEKLDKITLNEILTGKIRTFESVKKSIFANYELLNELNTQPIQYLSKNKLTQLIKPLLLFLILKVYL